MSLCKPTVSYLIHLLTVLSVYLSRWNSVYVVIHLRKVLKQFVNYFFGLKFKNTMCLLITVFTLSFSSCNTWSDQNHVGLLVCRLQDKTPRIVHWLARAYYFLLDVKKFWNRVDHRLSGVSFLYKDWTYVVMIRVHK